MVFCQIIDCLKEAKWIAIPHKIKGVRKIYNGFYCDDCLKIQKEHNVEHWKEFVKIK